MSNKNRLLSAFGTFQERIYTDDNQAGYVINTKQDCTDIIAMCKRLSEEHPGQEFRHVGFIPQVFCDQLMREGRWNDTKEIHRWLDDPDHKYFRTWPGRLGGY